MSAYLLISLSFCIYTCVPLKQLDYEPENYNYIKKIKKVTLLCYLKNIKI